MSKVEALKSVMRLSSDTLYEDSYLYVGFSAQAERKLSSQLNELGARPEPDSGDRNFSSDVEYCLAVDASWFISDFKRFFSEVAVPNCSSLDQEFLNDYFFYQQSSEVVRKCFENIKSWFLLLSQIANHRAPNSSQIQTFWITSSTHDNNISSHVIEFSSTGLSYEQVQAASPAPQLVGKSDPHKTEKIYLLRRILSKLLGSNNELKLQDLIDLWPTIVENYDNEFQNYISKFGVDKSLNEIMDQRLKLVDSITKSSLDAKAKFLAAPAVMLATVLLRSSEASFLSLLLILGTTFLILQSMSKTARTSMMLAQKGAFRLLDNIKSDQINEDSSPLIQKEVDEEKRKLKKEVNDNVESIETWTTAIGVIFLFWILLHLSI